MDEVVDEFCVFAITHLSFDALTDDIMANCFFFSHIHVEMTIIVSTVTCDAVYLASGLTFMYEEKILLQVYLTSVAVLALTVVKQCFRGYGCDRREIGDRISYLFVCLPYH